MDQTNAKLDFQKLNYVMDISAFAINIQRVSSNTIASRRIMIINMLYDFTQSVFRVHLVL